MVGEQPCQAAGKCPAVGAGAMPIPRVDPMTIAVLPLSVILLLISPAGAMPNLVLSYYTRPGRGDVANWFMAGTMTEAPLRNARAIRSGEPRRIGIGAGIAPIWRNSRYVRDPKVIDAR